MLRTAFGCHCQPRSQVSDGEALKVVPNPNRATRIVASACGVIIAFAGFEHGLGEVLQGSKAPSGIVIQSWPGVESFKLLAGEPAMTLVPNLMATGILAMLVAVAIAIWSVFFIQRPGGGPVLVALSALLLLVGGGFASPLMGLGIGVTATRIRAPLRFWRSKVPRSIRRPLAAVWKPALVSAVVGYLTLVPGFLILVPVFGIDDPRVVIALTAFSFASLVVAILGALAEDSLTETADRG